HVVRWYIHLLYDAVGVAAGDAHAALVGAVAIASGNGHGRLHGDAADERVLPGVAHLAQDEERPVLRNVDRDLRVPHVLGSEPRRDRAREAPGGAAARGHIADERHGYHALLVDGVEAGEVGVAVDEDAQLVA